MRNNEVAEVFGEIADLLEIKGENPFRIRAYRRAGQNIEGLPKDIENFSREELLKVPGIGRDLADKVSEYLTTGVIASLEQLKQEVPAGLAELLLVPGLGPKKVRLLHEKLGIRSIDELEQQASTGRLTGLTGIGNKTEDAILRGISMIRRGRERLPLGKVMPLASEIVGYLMKHSPVTRAEIAGSLRRWKETVRDMDILATSDRPGDVIRAFAGMPAVREVLVRGPIKASIVTGEGIQADLRVVGEKSYGAALLYFTGSKGHNIRLREMAARKGLKISEYGIFREKDGRRLGGEEEADVYKALGLDFIPPELREDSGEVEAAARHGLPTLVEEKDILGDLHVHSNASDGRDTLEDLIAAGRERGYEYLAVTDHSAGLGIARGLKEDRILEQKNLIDSLNKKVKGFMLFTGTELNIRSDGSPDVDEELLRKLDIVVASVHSGFRQPRDQLTHRLVSAARNPCVSVIAHPTGRLIGEREPYDVDMEAVLDAAAATGTAVEINAHPLRLDLDDRHAKRAGEKHVPVVISTDAHAIGQLGHITFGVSVARRAWLTKRDILNTRKGKDLLKFFRSKVARVRHLQAPVL